MVPLYLNCMCLNFGDFFLKKSDCELDRMGESGIILQFDCIFYFL